MIDYPRKPQLTLVGSTDAIIRKVEKGAVQAALVKAIGLAAAKHGSQAKLAAQLGVHENTVSSWKGGRTQPSNEQFVAVFEIAELSMDASFGLRTATAGMDEQRVAERAVEIMRAELAKSLLGGPAPQISAAEDDLNKSTRGGIQGEGGGQKKTNRRGRSGA